MELDTKTRILVELSAAISANALVGIRESFTKAMESKIDQNEIEETINIALQVQKQPISHTEHLIHQLMRESKKKSVTDNGHSHNHNHNHSNNNGCGCGCGCSIN